MRNTVRTFIDPEKYFIKKRVLGIKNAVVVFVKIFERFKSVFGKLTVLEHGIVAKKLFAVVYYAITI